MTLPPHLDDLFRHMAWADAVVWRAVLSAADHDDRTYKLLFHLHQVQWAFLSVWRGEERAGFKDFDAHPDLPSLAAWAREYHRQLPEHLAGIREEELNEVREVTWRRWVEKTIGRQPAATTLAETMMQVTQHSTYHRGQVNMRLRERGIEPPLTDFIAWVWLGKPATNWPI
ncbi:MAG TPA: DinB family protein [Thermoanaerobaculia bacterium]|nr:DinB family protein [Thermoanaerobaculia bacterium]